MPHHMHSRMRSKKEYQGSHILGKNFNNAIENYGLNICRGKNAFKVKILGIIRYYGICPYNEGIMHI